MNPGLREGEGPVPKSCNKWLTERDSNPGLAPHPPQASNTHSSGQSDLKICLFFHEFWAFWLYAFLSCSSSCSDLWVPSRHACHWVLREMSMPACLPAPPPKHLAQPHPSPIHAGLLQGAPPIQLLVVSSEDLHRKGGSCCVSPGRALTLSLSHLISQIRVMLVPPSKDVMMVRQN